MIDGGRPLKLDATQEFLKCRLVNSMQHAKLAKGVPFELTSRREMQILHLRKARLSFHNLACAYRPQPDRRTVIETSTLSSFNFRNGASHVRGSGNVANVVSIVAAIVNRLRPYVICKTCPRFSNMTLETIFFANS